ncbi:MAG: DUF1616 domain-containing protein [Candidatus Helarchaeota archaeon]
MIQENSFKNFIFHSCNYDLWGCIILTIITFPVALFIPTDALESGNIFLILGGVVRLLIGLVFIIFLPGYALFTVIWPERKKDDFTWLGLSFGLSLAIVPILGLILNFTPSGLTLESILMSTAIFTLLFLCGAFVRRYYELTKKENP